MTQTMWGLIALVFVLRAFAAFALPLTGDEAYYWEWSRRLAFGYVDHPPLVAWTIAAFGWFGHHPGVVRIGFVACGGVASLAVAGAATELTGDRRAGAIAALALALTPLATLAFGSASPDGPYLACWALALWFAVRAFARDRRSDWLLLGVAVGGVLLSRILGFGLLFGIVAYALAVRRDVWRRGLPLALLATVVTIAPFLAWNATHDWMTFTFALVHRHEQAHHFSLLEVLATQAVAYSPGIWAACLACVVRPYDAFLAWTALPQFWLVLVLSLFERVEIHWIFGFFVSVCAMLGIAYVRLPARARIVWTTVAAAPAALFLAVLFAFSFAPGATWALVQRDRSAHFRNNGPFEIMTYAPAAQDAARFARARNAIVMTDGYGLSSVFDFDAGLQPVLIGYNWQGREARNWYPDGMHPARALFVDKEPLASRPDFASHLARACGAVIDAGVHGYSVAGTAPRKYYFTWCDAMVPDGLAILRWEREPS
ncbi:MAG: glycosyltransferase family 39 protein [Candidatus Eremiobacteraeota bacterium]|nr:glycosyltransferase family 39 protein [Candidatus Eremiobacteraeota bacterium]